MNRIENDANLLGYVESLIGGRPENQDNYDFANTILGPIVVVCDGMGGGPAGRTASTLATNAIINYVKAAAASADPATVLREAVADANLQVIKAQMADNSLVGMGTTCVVILFARNSNKAYIIHVGDSRCYQLRRGKMIFRTNDHSFVGELVRNKTLTEEQARTAGNVNIITKAIGIKPKLEPESDVVTYKPGDRFALMSDGIWGTMPQDKLIECLNRYPDPGIAVKEITDYVDMLGRNKGTSYDNLTLAMVDIPRQGGASAQSAGRVANAFSGFGFMRYVLFCLLAIVIVFGGYCLYQYIGHGHLPFAGHADDVTATDGVDDSAEDPADDSDDADDSARRMSEVTDRLSDASAHRGQAHLDALRARCDSLRKAIDLLDELNDLTVEIGPGGSKDLSERTAIYDHVSRLVSYAVETKIEGQLPPTNAAIRPEISSLRVNLNKYRGWITNVAGNPGRTTADGETWIKNIKNQINKVHEYYNSLIKPNTKP